MRRPIGIILLVFLIPAASAKAQTGGAGGPQFAFPPPAPDTSRLPPVPDAASLQPLNSQPWQSQPLPPQPLQATPYGTTPPGTPPSTGPNSGSSGVNNSAGRFWTFDADSLWLQRATGSSTFLGQTVVGGSGGQVVDNLSANDQNFALRPGMRLALGLRVDDTMSWEAVYFGLQNWSASQGIAADPYGLGTVAVSPFTQTDKLTGGFDQSLSYSYSSRLHNAEFNGRRLFNNGPWSASALGGFRYFQWNESFNLTGVDQFFGATETISSRTGNYLVGTQIGGDVRRTWNRFSLGMTGKAGIYANFYDQSQSNLGSTGVSGLPGGGITPINSSSHGTGVAGVFDFSVLGTYRVAPHFSVRGGYQLLYVTGLALAPNQLAAPSHSGGVLLQGPMAGLEFDW